MELDLTNILIGFVGLILSGATFCCGRVTATKREAKDEEGRLARIETKLDRMGGDVNEMKADYKDTVRRLHERIDDHLRHDHGLKLPKTGD